MSDSIKRYKELVEEGQIDPTTNSRELRDEKIMNLLSRAVKAGKIVQVEIRAAEVQKEYGTASLLLGLQIAVDELLENEEEA